MVGNMTTLTIQQGGTVKTVNGNYEFNVNLTIPEYAGIKEIILCKENKKNIDEIKPLYLKGLTFHYVDDIKEVLDIALLKEKVKHPLDLTIKEEKENKGN